MSTLTPDANPPPAALAAALLLSGALPASREAQEQRAMQAEEQIGSLLDSEAYAAAPEEERRRMAAALLEQLERDRCIRNLTYDEENRLFSFQFADKTLGGVSLKDFSGSTGNLMMN